MRILYTMAGEGNGHATRSAVAMVRLLSRGHEVLAAAPDNSFRVLSGMGLPVVPIDGFTLAYDKGGMDFPSTMISNAARLGPMLFRNTRVAREIERDFRPDAVVTDLDRFGWQYASDRGLPCVSLDNHVAITRARLPDPVLRQESGSVALVSAVVDTLVPTATRFLATSFAPLAVRNDCASNTRILPPVLRPELLRAIQKPTSVGHVLVYQTNRSDAPALLQALKSFPHVPFALYGVGLDGPDVLVGRNGHIRVSSFNRDRFLNDLAATQSVISNGGHTLLSEAVALQKPVLSVPVRDHPEQSINASLLEQCGFGMRADRHDPKTIARFLQRVPAFRATLESEPRHDFNRALYEELDSLFPLTPLAQ